MPRTGRPPKYPPETWDIVADMKARGCSVEDIITKTGIPRNSLRSLASKKGLKKPLAERTQILQENRQQIVQMAQAGKTMPEICSALALDRVALFKFLRREEIDVQLAVKTMTSEEETTAIQFMKDNAALPLAKRRSNTELARHFSCSTALIKRLKRENGINRDPTDLYKYTIANLVDALTELKFSGRNIIEPIATNHKINVVCHCGTPFYTLVDSVLRGTVRSCGCLKSAAEIEVRDFVKSLGFEVEQNDYEQLGSAEIDIWIPEKKVGIEYCGLHWHGEKISKDAARLRHLNKLRMAEEKGIQLITIFADEWLERREQVCGYLKAILGKTEVSIGARETEVVSIDAHEARVFLSDNHIQGASGFHAQGLRYDGELVAVATWKQSSDRRGAAIPGIWELVRYAVKIDHRVRGGLSKLISNFINHHQVRQIITFSDLRWSRGNLYEAIGFVKSKRIPPNYWYFLDGDRGRYHKKGFRKDQIEKKLGPLLPGETEQTAMCRFGYDRIWDCGLDKWVKRFDR